MRFRDRIEKVDGNVNLIRQIILNIDFNISRSNDYKKMSIIREKLQYKDQEVTFACVYTDKWKKFIERTWKTKSVSVLRHF